MTTTTNLAPLLERFFTQRLMQQRQASPHTLSSYRDTFRQLLIFAQQRLHQPPSRLNVEQIDAPLIVAFLDDLENQRGVSVRSRNLRLTAIHSFFQTPPDLVVTFHPLDIVDVIFQWGITTACRVSTGHQGASGLHPLRRSVYH